MIDVLVSGTLPRGLSPALITATVRESFRRAKRVPKGSVAVHFVTENAIAKLNSQYRHIRRPTDVLSFSAREEGMPDMPSRNDGEWGDILVCTPYARREATRRGIPLAEEVLRLVSHGTLHLLGYDHATERDEMRMFALQEAAVERIMERV